VDPAGLLGAAGVLATGVLAPGWAVVRGLRLTSDGLAALVLAAAVGRLLFAGAALVATSTLGAPLLFAWLAAGAAAGLAVAWRRRGELRASRSGQTWLERLAPVGAASAAALLLVHAVVARSGLERASGDLLFFGRDATNDPLVYGAMALRLAADGLPLQLPFAGGGWALAPYGTYAFLAGLSLTSGAGILDLAFRIVPAFDALFLSLSGVALARALGGGALAAGATGVLLVLGGDLGSLVPALGGLGGARIQPLDSWALFGPYLAAFNPIAPAAHTWLAAAMLLASGRGASRAASLVIGLLTAALFELKPFLWAPAVAGLVAVALLRPPRVHAKPLRLAALVAIAASLPSIVDRLLQGARLAGRDETSFQLCIGCLPRYLADAAWGTHELSFASFRAFRLASLLDPAALLGTLAASVAVLAIAIGARVFAVPVLWRGGRDEDAPDAAFRWLGAGALLGLGAAFLVVTTPHYLNGAQFAWAATFGLWPPAALQLERLWRARSWAACALFVMLALASTAHLLGPLGYRAPVWQRVTAAERALLAYLPPRGAGAGLVLEPSMLADTDRASPVPWLTGHAVRLSLLSAVQSLPAAEREERFRETVDVFLGDDREAALRAIRASGAAWVYAPEAFPLRFSASDVLAIVARSSAGTLYRVRPDDERDGEPDDTQGERDGGGAQ
jgi:hypothetical protein